MSEVIPAMLIGMVLETLLLGAYLVVFATSCHTLITSKRRGWLNGSLNHAIIIADLAMFLSINAHWVLSIARLFEAFVSNHTSPLAYYELVSERKRVAKVALYVFQRLLADMIMVLRLYYVFSKNLTICVLPILTTLGLAVAGSGLIAQLATAQPRQDPFASGQWVLSCFTLTLVTTMYSTLLIAYKLWSTHKSLKNMNVRRFGDSRFPHVIQIMVESAAMYSTCTCISFVLFLCRSNTHFAVLDLTSPVVGLVLCLIVVRGRVPGHCPHPCMDLTGIAGIPVLPNQNQTTPPILAVSINSMRLIHHDFLAPANKTGQEQVEQVEDGESMEG